MAAEWAKLQERDAWRCLKCKQDFDSQTQVVTHDADMHSDYHSLTDYQKYARVHQIPPLVSRTTPDYGPVAIHLGDGPAPYLPPGATLVNAITAGTPTPSGYSVNRLALAHRQLARSIEHAFSAPQTAAVAVPIANDFPGWNRERHGATVHPQPGEPIRVKGGA